MISSARWPAVGSATDLWEAYRDGAFKPSTRPWLGYMMLLEDCPESRKPVAVKQPHFKVLSGFEKASYKERYEILVQKLVRDRLYDSACFLLSSRVDGLQGGFTEPHEELTFHKFVAPLLAHVGAFRRG